MISLSEMTVYQDPLQKSLARDQRTIVTLQRGGPTCVRDEAAFSSDQARFRAEEKSLNQHKRIFTHLRRRSSRLTTLKYLLFGCSLLHLLSLTNASPVPVRPFDLMLPCAGVKIADHHPTPPSIERIRDLMDKIKQICDIALNQARHNGEEYAQTVLEAGNMRQAHQTWRAIDDHSLYPNGKRLSKELGENLPLEYKESLQTGDPKENMTALLLDSYIRFQHLARAINEMIQEIKDHGEEYTSSEKKLEILRETFLRSREMLQQVLCEIYDALVNFGVNPNEHITPLGRPRPRQHKVEDLKAWVIFREYANQLEFNIEAFKILIDRISIAEKNIAMAIQ